MSGGTLETRQGGEAMASSGAGRVEVGGGGENEGGRVDAERSKAHWEPLMNGAGALKLEAVSADGENSSRSNQGSMRTSFRGDEGSCEGVKRASRRKGEPEGVSGSADTPHRPRLERSAKRGDSGTKPTGKEIDLNEGVVESSMFKQVKFENGAAITQSGLTDADDKGNALEALAAVMALYGIPKEVVGRVADFPGETWFGSKQSCRVCRKPETAKHTIICDKCQGSYHLGCVKLKPKQAVEIENEHWQCESCGPELGSPYWPLGRITPLHDRRLADPKVVESINAVERRVVTLMDAADAAATSIGGDRGGRRILENVNTPRTIDQEFASFSKESILSAKRRGRGRPKRDEMITANNLGVLERGLSEEQPALDLGNIVSAPQPSALTPELTSAPSPAVPSQIPLVGVTDTLTTTNDNEIQGDSASLQPQSMLEDLRTFIEGMNLKLEKGWEVIIKQRPSNPLVSDKIYISPDGHKFRSRLQVARYLENPKPRLYLQPAAQRTNVQPAAQGTNVLPAAERLEITTQRADISLEGLKSSREMPFNLNLVEPQEEPEKRIEKVIPVVKESRSLPPAGDLLSKRLPVELVGDALEIWEFLCRFSDVLDLKSPLTYEELETGLVNLGPPASEDTISNVNVQHSSHPSNGESLEIACAEVGRDSPDKPADRSTDPCVGGTGFTLESVLNPEVQGENLEAIDPGFNRISKEDNDLKQDMSVTVKAGALPQSTVQKNTDPIPGPAELPGENVSLMERTVVSPDGTLNDNFVTIARTHIPLLKLVLSDLQFRINGSLNVCKSEEPKKKGRKPLYEVPQEIQVDVPEFSSDLPMNEVTWPEMVRRYLITLIEAEKYGDLTELKLEERRWLLRCLQGDGGVPCGALYTNLGAESDAQVLAEAEKELAVREPKDGETKEEENDRSEKLPEWVEALRPVAKMATNVGSRIRIKVKEALELGPPQWAKEQLEWSISKDVFKGNASGPTKKAVVEVLNHYEVSPPCESPIHKTKAVKILPSVEQVSLRCRVVLRTLAEADNLRAFSILIGGPEGHGSKRLRGMVSRPIDFRTIDARLAAGAYGGSVEAFAEDVRQIWKNVELLQKGGDVTDLATSLSRLFEDLLQKQVINFMNGTSEVKAKEPKADLVNVAEAGTEPTNTPLTRSHLASVEKPEDKLQRAPWQDDQTCRVCGVDEDYESIMLCDVCDEEYHTYCLNPPLTNVPEGNWFCPQCVALDKGLSDRKDGEVVEPEAVEGEGKKFPAGRKTLMKKDFKEVQGESASQSLLKQIESKDYWQLGLSERVDLLKFLCNEAVKSTQVRGHLEKSVNLAFDLQQQLSNLQLQREGVLKTRSHTIKGTQVSSVETWSSRLRHHPSGALGAEDIGVSMPRNLHFDSDGKADEHSAERTNTTTEGNNDLVIRSNETVSQASAPADRNTPLAVSDSADILKKRRIDDVSARDSEFVTQVERAEASTPERIMTRNSKRTKFEEHGESGDPQVEDTTTVALGSESKTDGVIDPEIQIKELVGSVSTGGRNTSIDESGELGRRAALRSSHSEHPDSSGVSSKIGVAAGGLPPRTPKRRLETSSSSETLKKLRTDVTVNGEGIVDGKSPLKVLKDNSVEESQSVLGTTQGIPALGEVIDDPHRDEAVSDPKRQGSLPSTECTPIMDAESTMSKLDAEIVEIESKLYNTTLRRDHLGIDDVGRHYWALSGPSRLPLLVVSEFDGIGRPESDGAEETYFSYVEHSERANSDGEILQYDHTSDRSKESKTRWWTYSSVASIDSLMAWLNPRVKLERELKSSISRWRETASLLESNQEKLNTSCLGNDTDGSLKKEQDTAKAVPKRFPTLKATSILQMRYGSSSFSDRASNKKSAMPMEGRVIRCSCLEPLWKFKWHCSACHETYESLAELESHKNVCSEGVNNSSFKKKQKGGVKGKNNFTPEKAKKTATSEKGKKTTTFEKGKKITTVEKGKKNTKAATPKDGIKRSLEKEDIGVHTGEENSWMSDDFTEPNRTATRGRRRAASHPDDGADVNGDLAVADEPVDDAFFLSDFQDDVHNPDMDNASQEDFPMNFGSFQSLLQDDEWEANLRPDRSDPKRKKHGLGKKSSKQPPTQGASEMALANFDYASLPMSFSTPDSTRDRILQIGCIADRGPTFAPALHFAPAFDPSLMIQPCYPDNQSPTDAGEFPGSSPLPSSQNGSPIGELGGLDAVSWYDPQTSGDVKSDVVFVPDSGDIEPMVQPGSGISTWDLAELVGLPKTEYDTLPADGGELDQQSNDETTHLRSLNTNGETQPLCTMNGEQAIFPVDEQRPGSVDLVPEALPAQDVEVPLEIASVGAETAPAGVEVAPAKVEVTAPKLEVPPVKVEVPPAGVEVPPAGAVVPAPGVEVPPAGVKTVHDMSLKKQAKKFAAPESSLRPLVGEQLGVLIGLKMRVLDMEAAMGAEALVSSKSAPSRRRAWRSLVKSAKCIYEMTKTIIILEQMVRPDCLKRTWCYWSSLSSAARSATLATLALRVFALDAAITYKKDKVVTDESLRPSSLRKPKKKIQEQSPLSSKSKRTNKAG